MKAQPIRPLAHLDATVTVPGSKSHTARALVIGALASAETVLRNPLSAEDIGCMIDGLRALGVSIEKGPETIRIQGTEGRLSPPSRPIFLGGAGTAVRFLTTAAGLAHGLVIIDGNERMRERPIVDLLEALAPLGITARSLNGNGCPPVVVHPGSFVGGRTKLRGEKSSQFLSSILLCGPYAPKGVEVEITGDMVSRSYVDLTIQAMRGFDAQVTHEDDRIYRVKPGMYRGRAHTIEGDMSSASYFFAAAAITGGRIRVKGISRQTMQGDGRLLDVLEEMGCQVQDGDGWVEVVGGSLRAVDVNMKEMPDSVQTLAVVAALARGRTRVDGVGHLRHKETDRLNAVKRELGKMGIQVTIEGESLLVQGGNPRGTEIDTYGDHRMAMAFAVAGLRVPGMVIRDPACVNKSFPAFWSLVEELG